MVDYKIIETETGGEVHVKINSQYNNINAEKVIVYENIKARFFGTISELIIVKTGAEVQIHGTINGKIENQGLLSVYPSLLSAFFSLIYICLF